MPIAYLAIAFASAFLASVIGWRLGARRAAAAAAAKWGAVTGKARAEENLAQAHERDSYHARLAAEAEAKQLRADVAALRERIGAQSERRRHRRRRAK